MAFNFNFNDSSKEEKILNEKEKILEKIQSRINGIKAQMADPRCVVAEEYGKREILRLQAAMEDVEKNT